MSAISSLGGGSLLGGTSGNLVAPGTTGSGTLTLSGLASGLNTNQIIQDLVALQQKQVSDLQNSASQTQAQQSAFQQLQSQLTTLQSDIASLAQSQGSAFDLHAVTSSNPSILTAAADSAAAPGVYSLTVNNLATANEIASQGFSSPSATITEGTLQIGAGSGASVTITIDNTNNTLQGLVNAINQTDVGVTASIINDGSGSANQPYRLLLTSNQTGAAQAIQLSNSLAADNNGAVQPVFDATYIGPAQLASGYTGTAVPTANSGSGAYTGTTNDTYTFTVQNSGTVGTDTIQLSFTNSSGSSKGTISLGAGDANVFKDVANGLQVELGAGTLVAGQSFTVKTYVPTVQAAANASVTVGSGSGALTVQNSTNHIDNLIPGVTLNLLSASPSSPVSITVTNDTSQATNAIQNLVNDYNGLTTFFQQAASYNATTQQGGILLGNAQVAEIQNQLRNIIDGAVPGLNPSLNNLGELGISFDLSGQLQLNQGQLNSVLDGGIPGVSLADVQRLFSLTGSSPDPGVQFVGGSDKTQASGNVPYQVSITQAAEQASITAPTSLDTTTVIDNTNNTFSITVNGKSSGAITLKPGTYTQAGLAQEVQNEINALPGFADDRVTASLNSGALVIATDSYGSTSNIAIGSGTALTPLKFAGTETGTGKDVAGSFLVNGVTESATGSGQTLTGNNNNASTSGLEVQVTLNDTQVGTGTQVPLTVTRGIASSLESALNTLLDPANGVFATVNAGFQTTLTNVQKQITADNTAIQAKENSLLQEFAAMEQAVSQLQSISNFLNLQFFVAPQQQSKLA